MMNREDVLRELELLPVWQLRAPLLPLEKVSQAELTQLELVAAISETSVTTSVTEVQLETVQVELGKTKGISESDSDLEGVFEPQSAISQSLLGIDSEEGHWMFVMPNAEWLAEETLLFQNICQALRIKAKTRRILADSADVLQGVQPKVLIALGEPTAQALLASTALLEDLRGTLHSCQGISLVVTYDLTHLLRHVTDKAKAWQDLCLALQVLQDQVFQD